MMNFVSDLVSLLPENFTAEIIAEIILAVAAVFLVLISFFRRKHEKDDEILAREERLSSLREELRLKEESLRQTESKISEEIQKRENIQKLIDEQRKEEERIKAEIERRQEELRQAEAKRIEQERQKAEIERQREENRLEEERVKAEIQRKDEELKQAEAKRAEEEKLREKAQKELEIQRLKVQVTANPSDAKLMHELGTKYYDAGDYDQASYWYRKSAQLGYAPARNDLADIHSKSDEHLEAFRLYSKAAEQGYEDADAKAKYELAINYYDRMKYQKAAEYFRRSAEQGLDEAQYRLGLMYLSGQGVAQNDDEAEKWLDMAAKQGHSYARFVLEDIHSCRNEQGKEESQTANEPEDAKSQHELGRKYYKAKDYSKVLHYYRMAAGQGYAPALNDLGDMYYNGRGVKQDYAEAFRLYRIAAENGDAKAQYTLGYMYYYGRGVDRNNTEALEWYRKSAEQGYSESQFMMGVIYGDKHDYSEALKWYSKAAENGHLLAQFKLREIRALNVSKPLEEEKHPPKNQSGDDTSDQKAQYELGEKYYDSKDYAKALHWFTKSAEQGNDKAQYRLGIMCYSGYGMQPDHEAAVKWLRKSAEQGNPSAKFILRNMTPSNEKANEPAPVKQSVDAPSASQEQCELGEKYFDAGKYDRALRLFRQSAEKGNATAQVSLGYMYMYGYGVTKNYKEAAKWLRLSAEQGNATAQANLGCMYKYGYGVKRDYAESVRLFRLSAEQGHTAGQYYLGLSYECGQGVAKNLDEARKWYQKAADQKYKRAQEALDRLK